MTTVTTKMPEALARKLGVAAKRQHTSRSALVRSAVEKYIEGDLPDASRPSAYDLIQEFAGTVEGPEDLSSNSRHMAGYGS